MTEREKLELGLWYDANHDEELLRARQEAEALYFELNHTNPRDTEKKTVLLKPYRNPDPFLYRLRL